MAEDSDGHPPGPGDGSEGPPARPAARATPTIVDVAERAGVSKSLVSLVLRRSPSVSEAKRAAVLEAVVELGYRPNAIARSLVEQRSRILGILVNRLDNPFFTDVIDAFTESALDHGYGAFVTAGNDVARRDAAALEAMLQLRMDGVMLGATVLDDETLRRAALRVPIVMTGRSVPDSTIDAVVGDEEAAARLVVEHLVSLGHRHIAHITGGPQHPAMSGGRLEAIHLAVERHGLSSTFRVVPGEFSEMGGIGGLGRLLASGTTPTAIIAPNDLAAVGVRKAAGSHGLRVPEDLSVVGYDDTYLAALGFVDLTSVRWNCREVGRLAFELLVSRRGEDPGPGRIRITKPTISIRGSTAPPGRR